MTERIRYPSEAIWLSPSSIADFDKCPRFYYLRNVYKDPKTSRKIQIVNPHLSLGSTVHATLESISQLRREERFIKPLTERFEALWREVSGLKGGFTSEAQELHFKERGQAMLQRVDENPGPLLNPAVKINERIPSMWLSEKDMLVLCGVMDWIEFQAENNALHIIDFKTGRFDAEASPLQIGIYLMLAGKKLKWSVAKLSFWYLEHENQPTEVAIPSIARLSGHLIEKGRAIKEARQPPGAICPRGGCMYCSEYEAVVQGRGMHVGVDQKMNKDLYLIEGYLFKS